MRVTRVATSCTRGGNVTALRLNISNLALSISTSYSSSSANLFLSCPYSTSNPPLSSSKPSISQVQDMLMPVHTGKKSFYLETFGCQMNVSDSEIVDRILKDAHYTRTQTAEEADVILTNTCAIRENAGKQWFLVSVPLETHVHVFLHRE